MSSPSVDPLVDNTQHSKHPLAALGFSGAISIHWFIQLRWVAVLGQLFAVLIVQYVFEVPLQVVPLLITIAVTTLSNLVLTMWYLGYRNPVIEPGHSRLWPSVLAAVMAIDLLFLTVLLYYSGGPSNPFWIFYFVNLCMAGIELAAWIAWSLNFLAAFCFAFLVYDHHPLLLGSLQKFLPCIRESGTVTLEHYGVYCAFVTSASVIVFFSTLVTSKLRKREEEIRDLESKRVRGEKLEALGTLAAGAAHELATPLGTIAIIVGELQHELAKPGQSTESNSAFQEDVSLIRSELDRCRAILNHMSAQAGEGTIEKKETLTGQELLDMILAQVKQTSRIKTVVSSEAALCKVSVGPYVTAQALRGTIKNALEASAEQSEVQVEISYEQRMFVLTVTDQGEGISEQILSRIGEPFFTTKQAGKGMGLGVFLARTVVERLGGSMQVTSIKGQGSTVTCRIPSQM